MYKIFVVLFVVFTLCSCESVQNLYHRLLGIDDKIKEWIGVANTNDSFSGAANTTSEHPFVAALVRKSDKRVKCTASFCTLKHLITSCSCVVEVNFRKVKKKMVRASVQLSAPDDYVVVPGYNLKREIGVKSFKEYPGCHFYEHTGIWEHDFGFVEVEGHFEILYSTDNLIPHSSFFQDLQLTFIDEYTKGRIVDCFTVVYARNSSVFVPVKKDLSLITQDDCYASLCEGSKVFCSKHVLLFICAKAENVSQGAPIICGGKVRGVASGSRKNRNLTISIFTPFHHALEQVDKLDRNLYSSSSYISVSLYVCVCWLVCFYETYGNWFSFKNIRYSLISWQ